MDSHAGFAPMCFNIHAAQKNSGRSSSYAMGVEKLEVAVLWGFFKKDHLWWKGYFDMRDGRLMIGISFYKLRDMHKSRFPGAQLGVHWWAF